MNANAAGSVARIGPNAIIRIAEAMAASTGADTCRAVFAQSGLAHYLAAPPREMVAETEVIRLHGALHEVLRPEDASLVSRDAGRRTGDYLLAHRIPKFAQIFIKALPRALAYRVLVGAMTRNAWTFVGSGTIRVSSWSPVTLEIRNSPLARNGWASCSYYAGCFERLYQVLIGEDIEVKETCCQARGADCCRFAAGRPSSTSSRLGHRLPAG